MTNILNFRDFVLSEKNLGEIHIVFQILNFADAIGAKLEHSQLGKLVQVFNLCNFVASEKHFFHVNQGVNVFNFADVVVALLFVNYKLKFLQLKPQIKNGQID